MDFSIISFVVIVGAFIIGFLSGNRGKKELYNNLTNAYHHSKQQEILIKELKKVAYGESKASKK